MSKLVFKKFKNGRPGKVAPASVVEKRVATPDGGWKTVRTLDAHSPSFDQGLQYVFAKNVAKARRENKRLLGSADGVRRKG
jgi:hypothetical protein